MDQGISVSTQRVGLREWVWQSRPMNIWVAMPPTNGLQARVLDALRERLTAHDCVFVESPDEETDLGPVAHLAIGFGTDLEAEIDPREVYGRLPKPRGAVIMITTVGEIPESENLFHLARRHNVRKACHNGIILEGSLDGGSLRRALWGSMAGNHVVLNGREVDVLDGLALRMLVHAGAEPVNVHAADDEAWMTWEQWRKSPLHEDISEAAYALGEAGIIEDEVILEMYGSRNQARRLLSFLRRAALGEGMRSQLDTHLRVMGVTTTGGGKVAVSADAVDGDVVPICQLTWNGYVRANPQDCPITFRPPSIETHENGLVYLAGALVNAGLVHDFDSFLRYIKDHFAEHDTIDILPRGMQPKVLAIDHFHLQPRQGSIADPSMVEVVGPDHGVFPEVDFPCGVREAELHLLSALFQSEAFREPGPLNKAVIAVLPGHGSVAVYGGPRRELTDLLVNGMQMEDVVRV